MIDPREAARSETKLAPCPFCGGPSIVAERPSKTGWRVMCQTDCEIFGDFDTRKDAIGAWNRRAEPSWAEGIEEADVERVARALFNHWRHPAQRSWKWDGDLPEHVTSYWREGARLAIRSLITQGSGGKGKGKLSDKAPMPPWWVESFNVITGWPYYEVRGGTEKKAVVLLQISTRDFSNAKELADLIVQMTKQ